MNDTAKNAKDWADKIDSMLSPLKRKIRIMEVCGTHTVEIFRAGIRQLLPSYVELMSGPGCPVCVTPEEYIDLAIEAAKKGVIIATFGDMLKVEGSRSTLSEVRASGGDVRVVYSPLETLTIAKENKDKLVAFLAVGFETTAPLEAGMLLNAKKENIDNLCVLSGQRLVPPALRFLLNDSSSYLDGFLLPGHVAVVTGIEPFRFIAEEYGISAVVTGFEANDIMRGIFLLLHMIAKREAVILNAYERAVRTKGNVSAQKILNEVYEKTDAQWRGLGKLPLSGLRLKKEFEHYELTNRLFLNPEKIEKKTACRCGEVLMGKVTPKECPLFGKACTPLGAKGPCMVSVEGVCAAWYKYGRGSFFYE